MGFKDLFIKSEEEVSVQSQPNVVQEVAPKAENIMSPVQLL